MSAVLKREVRCPPHCEAGNGYDEIGSDLNNSKFHQTYSHCLLLNCIMRHNLLQQNRFAPEHHYMVHERIVDMEKEVVQGLGLGLSLVPFLYAKDWTQSSCIPLAVG